MVRFRSWPKKKYLPINTYQLKILLNKGGKIIWLRNFLRNHALLLKSKWMKSLTNFYPKSFQRKVMCSLSLTFFMGKFLHKWIVPTLMRLLLKWKVRDLTSLNLFLIQKLLNRAQSEKNPKSYLFWIKPRIIAHLQSLIIPWMNSIATRARRISLDFWVH
jgi:hypothetical protein